MSPLFATHILNADGIEKAKLLAERFDEFLEDIESLVDNTGTREWSLAKTQLEIASMFAKKALAVKPENQ